ncbi:hypothetical protein, partial [uncultured Flavobacterium sp.]|uniref:hypothetical protein n=1 Tax=uncultured Flavobacterium sp. TaxID=165435 RepID=UPI0030EE4F71
SAARAVRLSGSTRGLLPRRFIVVFDVFNLRAGLGVVKKKIEKREMSLAVVNGEKFFFFLYTLQIFDARLRMLRTFGLVNSSNLDYN